MQLSRHFHLDEFECRDGTAVPGSLQGDLKGYCVSTLERLRTAYFRAPMRITSGYRTNKHNKKVGGAARSYHLYHKRPGKFALDFTVKGWRPASVYGALVVLMNSKIIPAGGIGLYASWVHYDNRGHMVTWGG